MRYLIPTLLALFFSTVASATLSPQTPAPLKAHLSEVNAAWKKQPDNPELNRIVRFDDDRARIQTHLRLTERVLRERSVTVPASLRRVRLEHLEVLRTYLTAGVFPRNIHHDRRQPYFVDHLGTACAVGHLVRESGATTLVRRISCEHNYAYLDALTEHYPELTQWAQRNGFTTEELAWIQPGYVPAPRTVESFGNNGGANGEITTLHGLYDEIYFGGNFTEIDGFAAEGIARYDEANGWHLLGGGIGGSVRLIKGVQSSSLIAVVGDFTLNSTGESAQLALYNSDTDEWDILLDGNWAGTINDVEFILNIPEWTLVTVGAFEEIDGEANHNIAVYRLNSQTWAHTGSPYFGTDGAVSCLTRGPEGRWFIGGEFDEVSRHTNFNTTSLQTNSIAAFEWGFGDWIEQSFSGTYDRVDDLGVVGSTLFVIEHRTETTYLHSLKAGLWSFQTFSTWDFSGPARLNGFHSYATVDGSYDGTYLYGDYFWSPLLGSFGTGINQLHDSGGMSSMFYFEGEVFAATRYQLKTVFVGDFTEINGESIQQIAITDFSPVVVSSTTEGTSAEIQVFATAENVLITRYRELSSRSSLQLYSAAGVPVVTQQLHPGSGQHETLLNELPTGVYFWQLTGDSGNRTGRIFIP